MKAVYPEAVFDDVFGETITYNGKPIIGIVTITETGQSGNGFSSTGTSDFATVSIKKSDVPEPSVSDRIMMRGQAWRYVHTETDDNVRMRLKIRRNVRHA